MRKLALIVIDMINDGFEGWDSNTRNMLTSNINVLANQFRRHGHPVIWVRQEFESDLSDAFLEMRKKNIRKYIRGTSGSQILPELKVYPVDRVLVKKRYSSFFETPLENELRKLGAETLVLAGVNTHACIRMTAIDAYQRDWDVMLAEDCIASYSLEWHRASMEYMKNRIASVHTIVEIDSMISGVEHEVNR